MQTDKVAVKKKPADGEKAAGKITQSPASQGGAAVSFGSSRRFDFDAHHCARFAAERHADQAAAIERLLTSDADCPLPHQGGRVTPAAADTAT
jgi:hypothetical protein